jgi:hypothetical protein
MPATAFVDLCKEIIWHCANLLLCLVHLHVLLHIMWLTDRALLVSVLRCIAVTITTVTTPAAADLMPVTLMLHRTLTRLKTTTTLPSLSTWTSVLAVLRTCCATAAPLQLLLLRVALREAPRTVRSYNYCYYWHCRVSHSYSCKSSNVLAVTQQWAQRQLAETPLLSEYLLLPHLLELTD